MIILGIDPGLAATGYGVIKSESRSQWLAIDWGVIKTSTKTTFPQRLCEIYHSLEYLIKKYRPDKITVETIYFAKNVKTAIKVGEARGVAILAAARNNIPVSEFTPLQVKQALTGYGRATKSQIQKMVKIILNLPKAPAPDDAADGLAIALTGGQSFKINIS